jgi:hypothetical protein
MTGAVVGQNRGLRLPVSDFLPPVLEVAGMTTISASSWNTSFKNVVDERSRHVGGKQRI